MEKITEVQPPPGGWVFTGHQHTDGSCYELERESPEEAWKCPACGKTLVELFQAKD